MSFPARSSFIALFTSLLLSPLPLAAAAVEKVEIAAALSITGDASTFGAGSLEGIRLAIEEANASGVAPHIDLKVYDAKSDPEVARKVAAQVVASPAALVIGPTTSFAALAAGPIYGQAGLTAIIPTATSDEITNSPTSFRMISKNSAQGELLAYYLHRVLGQPRATVIVQDDTYGQTTEKGFRTAAGRLGIDATYYTFKSGEQLDEMAMAAAQDIGNAPVVLATLEADGARILPIFRRLGVNGPFLGTNAFGNDDFNSHFADLPEEKEHPGYFCENLYAIAPVFLDSANAEVLEFSERFQKRYGHLPPWTAVAGYDAARLAVEALRATNESAGDTSASRAAVLKYLLSLNDPLRASRGLLGPLAFDATRGRQTAMRMGRFNHGRLESAPTQIISVLNPHETDIKSGAVFETQPGKYARLKQVIYAGLYVNEVMWMDQPHFTFAADFYVWIRFVKNSAPGAADPTEIKFPDLSTGRFDREHPVEQREMPDGTSYYLWRVQGEFRNPFDLHRYPFDRQTLRLRFFNARAAADRIVYALDLGAAQLPADSKDATVTSGASAEAFRGLTQWDFVGAHQSRETFVAKSSLGDPHQMGRENFRELSGYVATFELQRHSFTTLMKSLLPLWLMTCILYASLHFPASLVQPKIGVAMTAVLTGVVLLNLVNSQLGSVGYTVAVEYAFYVYFALGLLQIVSVLLSEHLRAIGRPTAANRADILTRIVFIGSVISLFTAAAIYA
jgi:branched-chain amino acid transport system substrate-binding protein